MRVLRTRWPVFLSSYTTEMPGWGLFPFAASWSWHWTLSDAYVNNAQGFSRRAEVYLHLNMTVESYSTVIAYQRPARGRPSEWFSRHCVRLEKIGISMHRQAISDPDFLTGESEAEIDHGMPSVRSSDHPASRTRRSSNENCVNYDQQSFFAFERFSCASSFHSLSERTGWLGNKRSVWREREGEKLFCSPRVERKRELD